MPRKERGLKCVEFVETFANAIAHDAGLSLKLSDNRIDKASFEEVAARAINDGAMIVNPKAVSKEDVLAILEAAY